MTVAKPATRKLSHSGNQSMGMKPMAHYNCRNRAGAESPKINYQRVQDQRTGIKPVAAWTDCFGNRRPQLQFAAGRPALRHVSSIAARASCWPACGIGFAAAVEMLRLRLDMLPHRTTLS